MKKLLFPILLFTVYFSFAQEDLKYCGADEMRINTLKQNPKIANAVIARDIQLAKQTRAFEKTNKSACLPVHLTKGMARQGTRAFVYTIPIVFHVIHNYGTENISDAQILDGIVVLNKTFRKLLADTGSIVAAFKPIHADCEIEFKLATRDPAGNCTKGINRIASPLTTIGDHSVKSLIQWPTNQYLNIYIVANAAGLAGHCVWPADADTIPAWDGIVISSDYVGTIGTSNYTKSVAFAHECGHYLNLHHIWGGNNVPGFYYLPCNDTANCSSSDSVADTPPTKGWVSCTLAGASCGNVVDNVQNTMDYSYCNRMFTYGQKARMQACLNSSIAGRNNLWSPANLIATGTDSLATTLCAANFTSDKTVVCESSLNVVTFTNTSYNGPVTGYEWNFAGGTPAFSTAVNPTVTYTIPGKYDVSLSVYNGTDTVQILKTNYISVLPDAGSLPPYSEGFESTVDFNGLDWFETNFDTLNNWELTNTAAYGGNVSAVLKNIDNTQSTKDELVSEIIDLSSSSGMSISFRYAFAKRDSTCSDKLVLMITNNCNSPWIPRITLTLPALETAPLTTASFIPADSSEWKYASNTIPTSYLTSGFRFKLVHTSSGGNNVYVDDINLGPTIGVDDLNYLNNNVMVYPNPATNNATLVMNLSEARNLTVNIIDLLGKTVFTLGEKNYVEGENKIHLDLSTFASGMYQVRVGDSKIKINKQLVIINYK
jgi:PKD repeat protein